LEIIVREGDSREVLRRKSKLATVLGFLQSQLTDFNFISSKWKQNCIEDRILGLSLTGLRDHEVLGVIGYKAEGWLKEMYAEAHAVETTLANIFGIEPAKAITCVKPSGTVSQVADSASGLHVRYAKQYIRRIRMAVNDPLAKMLIAQGLEYTPENGETYENARTYVFSFPIKAPSSSKVKAEVSALQQLDYWRMLKISWCDHNPSCTVYVRDHEWVAVAAWVYENFDIMGGISFLPDENSYEQAPYEEITHDEYIHMLSKFPVIDLTKLSEFEKEDYTTGAQEAACSGGNCELN
jgi:ribonucleoside-diphosphate reductase alpha chain